MSKVDVWSVAFTLFFLILMLVGYRIVVVAHGIPAYLDPWQTLILALASFRLTRLIVYDNITEWFRDLVRDSAPRTFLGTVRALVNCPWCTGLWAALVVSVLYLAWPQLWFFVFVLALGGLASFIQLLANLTGWHAEYKKIDTQNFDRGSS